MEVRFAGPGRLGAGAERKRIENRAHFGVGAPGRDNRAAAERPPPRGTGGPEEKKAYVPADENGPAAFERESGGIGRGGCAPPLPRGTKKASRTDFPIHTRTPDASREKSPAFPLYKKLQRKYNDSCKVRLVPLCMEGMAPYAGGGVFAHPVPALHFFVP